LASKIHYLSHPDWNSVSRFGEKTMKMDFSSPSGHPDRECSAQPITVFQAEQKEYGFRITPAGRYPLQPAVNQPQSVIAFLELSGQQVPVIRPKTQPEDPSVISSQSCVVLFEHKMGEVVILTGRLFDNVSQVLDLIAELSDMPNRTEVLYTSFEESILPHQTDQQNPLRMQDSH
jgi:hypothetical protein